MSESTLLLMKAIVTNHKTSSKPFNSGYPELIRINFKSKLINIWKCTFATYPKELEQAEKLNGFLI